ncbi:class I SAM-dependent methyltransferase [Bacillus solitudinis]|uniref:class I SAM-dependent methyltransferase n=1 Tax=Bacillus solitudinis TaxID=2014074 RepID=UPI000C2479FC|nr:class I SAM-dependent methyltransferase [Bacillus solitudinis]
MKLRGVLPFARFLLEEVLEPGDIAIDCTAGNGHDSVFLAKLVPAGHVYSFDIQIEAIENTRTRLEEHDLSHRVTLIHEGHETVKQHIPVSDYSKVHAAIFNLGYLPGGDKTIVTEPSSTIQAIDSLLTFMPRGGTIVLVIYHGHEKGKIEKEYVEAYTESLDQQHVHVLKYQFINQDQSPPFVIAIEKR